MLLSDEKLFLEKLNTEIPELKVAEELFRGGDFSSARRALVVGFKDIARKNLTATLEKDYLVPEDKDAELAFADEILLGWVAPLGMRYKFEDGVIDWAKNPTYNDFKEWPFVLSRHGEFLTLASAYYLTGDEKYAKRFSEMMRSWLDQAICPENDEVSCLPWWRALEAGMRFGTEWKKAWNYAIFAFLDSPSISEELWLDIIRSIWEHGYRLRNFYNAVGNPLIMEMNGLAYIALLYPIFKDSRDWHEFAHMKFDEQLDLQIYPDGFHCELATGYHRHVLNSYLGYFNLLYHLNITIPENMRTVVMEMTHVYIKTMLPDGYCPGLNDGNRLVVKDIAASAINYANGDPVLNYFASGGKEGHLPEYNSVAMPYSGFSISRTGWGENDICSFFESAPFGRAHAHEDKLGFYLHAYGKSLLSDSGNYNYDTSAMRNFVISTYGHNTVLVDRMGQNRRKTHKWDPSVLKEPSDLSWSFSEDLDVCEGEYSSGYGRNLLPVTHRRKVIFYKKGYEGTKPFFVIVDNLTPKDDVEHTYEVLFQLGVEPITELTDGVRAHHSDGVTLTLLSTAKTNIKIGEKEPRFVGWRPNRAPTLEEPEHFPAPAVLFTEKGGKARVVTVVYPTNEPEFPIKSVELCDRGFALIFDNGNRYELDENSPEFESRPASFYLTSLEK